MSDKLVFEQTIEGLFVRGLGARMTPKLKDRLRAEGLDLDYTLHPAYSFEKWCRFVAIANEELHGGALESGYQTLGERVVDGFRESFLGRAVFGVLKTIGPKRALYRLKQSFRAGNNYSEGTVTEVGTNQFEVWMNECGDIRHLTSGILLAGVRAAGAKDPRVTVKSFDADGVTYSVSWG